METRSDEVRYRRISSSRSSEWRTTLPVRHQSKPRRPFAAVVLHELLTRPRLVIEHLEHRLPPRPRRIHLPHRQFAVPHLGAQILYLHTAGTDPHHFPHLLLGVVHTHIDTDATVGRLRILPFVVYAPTIEPIPPPPARVHGAGWCPSLARPCMQRDLMIADQERKLRRFLRRVSTKCARTHRLGATQQG